MKQGLLLTTLTLGALAAGASAATILTEPFTYTDGALAGQGPWVQNAATATNPIQVTGNDIGLTTTGQDVYANFATSIPATDGTFAYYGLTLNVSAAQATGDYFAHFTNGVTNPINFSGRLAAKSGTTGYLLGYSESTAGGTTYGTTELAFGTDYSVIVRYGFVAGTLNDTGAVFVTPVGTPFDPTESNNTPYVTDAYSGTTAEIGAFTGFQFRQGTLANAPSVASIDNLNVATTFAEAIPAAVPEPTTFLTVLSGAGFLTLLRRRRR